MGVPSEAEYPWSGRKHAQRQNRSDRTNRNHISQVPRDVGVVRERMVQVVAERARLPQPRAEAEVGNRGAPGGRINRRIG
jgi:hypothetical protein